MDLLDRTRTALPHAIHDEPFFTFAFLRFLYLSPTGRIGRGAYWGSLGTFLLVIIPLTFALLLLRVPDAVLLPWAIVQNVAVVGMALMVQIKRLHDRNRPWWMLVCNLIPLVNVWLMIDLGFLRGTPGENRYGPPPGHSLVTPEQARTRFEAGEVLPFASPRDRAICSVLHGLVARVFPDPASTQHRDIERQWLTALGLAYEGRPFDRFADLVLPGLAHDIRVYLCFASEEDLARMEAALAGADPIPELRRMLPDELWETPS